MPNTISKSKLKAKMLEVFRQIETSGNELVVTDRDKPVLKIIPIKHKDTVYAMFGDLQGQIIYLEDINTPSISDWYD
jgi:antitoxin (DNA-binding transcriptional repressor) of toxin-antitoxin stability system